MHRYNIREPSDEHVQHARAFSAAAAAVVSLVLILDDLCQTTVTFIHRREGSTAGQTVPHDTIYLHSRALAN